MNAMQSDYIQILNKLTQWKGLLRAGMLSWVLTSVAFETNSSCQEEHACVEIQWNDEACLKAERQSIARNALMPSHWQDGQSRWLPVCLIMSMAAQVKVEGDPLLETRILENSMLKICSLLAVGFGDAGAMVIGDNIRSAGDLNPMIPGRKITAIFGFCDIRQFTDATEVLQVCPFSSH